VLAWRRPGEQPELDDAVAGTLARLAETAPGLEPLVLGEDADALRARFGHAAAEGPRAFLLREIEPGQRLRPLVLLPLRSARLRRRPFPEVETLVVVPLPPGAATRDLWALASTARAARAAGVPVVLTSRPSEPDGLDGRLVRRLLAAEGGEAPPGVRAAAV
jgi:hypothetical protein